MQAMNVELHNMEIALQRFQDLFSSIEHKARCRYQIKEL
jgi:hypothetical protein